MGARIMPGRSWTNKIRLPEELTSLDVSTPVGAAAAGATVRILNSCTTIDDIGNVLAVAGSVSTSDSSSKAPVVIGKVEYTYLVDGNGNEHKVSNPETIKTFVSNGMTVTKVIEEDITG